MHPTIPQTPSRSPHEISEDARHASCGQCWQQPGPPCTASGDHLARYLRAERRGLITREDLAAVLAGLDVIAAHVIIPGGAL